MIWAALPCTAWSSWQYVNHAANSATAEGIEQERAYSRKMIKVFVQFMKKVITEENVGKVYAACEWPRNASGWNTTEMKGVHRLLPWRADFDGCTLGLESSAGEPLTKPWRIQTNMDALGGPLGLQRCQGGHAHGVTRGHDAYRSSYYTPALVELVGRTVVMAEVNSLEEEDAEETASGAQGSGLTEEQRQAVS